MSPTKTIKPGSGLKHDGGKVNVDLFPPEAFFEISKVLTFGAKKYSPHNWRGGMLWSRLYAAAQRHLNSWMMGEKEDAETGLSHLAHAACCIVFLLVYELTNTGTDDRFKYEEITNDEA